MAPVRIQGHKLMMLAREIIRRDSTNRRGTWPLAEFVGSELRARGFDVSYQKVRYNGCLQANLIAHKPGAAERGLLINTHLDTVTTDPHRWTRTGGNPFQPTLHKGRLYGLGAADTKTAMASQLIALDSLKLTKLKCPLWLTGTYGEEMGLIGVQKLIRERSIKPAYILNTEPTELMPVKGNYGYRIYRLAGFQFRRSALAGYVHHIHFQGRAAHSATPSRGRNAIWQAWRWLRTQGQDSVVLSMQGGVAPNIVAADCWLEVLSPQARPKNLRTFGGKILSSEFVSQLRACPEMSLRLRQVPIDLLALNNKRETSNCGQILYGLGQFEWTVSHRFAPGIDPEQRYLLWKKRFRGLSGAGAYLSLSIVKSNEAFQQNTSCRLVKQVRSTLKEMRRPTKMLLRPGCTEAGLLARLGGDVITIGPGEAYGNIHEPNESVQQKELKAAVVLYSKLIERICL